MKTFRAVENIGLCLFVQVCELDIIFNFEKAYFILDEFLMGGEIQDTSKKSVLKAIEQADLLQEVTWASPITSTKDGQGLGFLSCFYISYLVITKMEHISMKSGRGYYAMAWVISFFTILILLYSPLYLSVVFVWETLLLAICL